MNCCLALLNLILAFSRFKTEVHQIILFLFANVSAHQIRMNCEPNFLLISDFQSQRLSHKSQNTNISGHGIMQSSSEFSQISVESNPSTLPRSSETVETVKSAPQSTSALVTPNIGLQKCVTACQASAFTKSAPNSHENSLLHSFEAPSPSDDEFIAEDEKWRTDRFFLGTHLYVAINPRALTEQCASGNNCPFHPYCDFAHASSELRERPLTQMWNFKTKLCDKFHSFAACCPYGNRWYAFSLFTISA